MQKTSNWETVSVVAISRESLFQGGLKYMFDFIYTNLSRSISDTGI